MKKKKKIILIKDQSFSSFEFSNETKMNDFINFFRYIYLNKSKAFILVIKLIIGVEEFENYFSILLIF